MRKGTSTAARSEEPEYLVGVWSAQRNNELSEWVIRAVQSGIDTSHEATEGDIGSGTCVERVEDALLREC